MQDMCSATEVGSFPLGCGEFLVEDREKRFIMVAGGKVDEGNGEDKIICVNI